MKKIIYFLFILFILTHCDKGQYKVEKTIEDGVEVVVNHLKPYRMKDEPTALTLVEKFTIDTEKNDIAELGLIDIWTFNVDSNGNIYLWNSPRRKGNLVYKFDANADFLKSFLTSGQGPGEVQSPSFPFINEQDIFVITDYFPKKLCFFNLEGELIGQIPFKTWIRVGYPLNNGKYFVIEREQVLSGEYVENRMILYDSNLEPLKRLHTQREESIRVGAKINGILLEGVFILWAISRGNIYIGDNSQYEYEILVYDYEGNLRKKIRKEYNRVAVTEKFKSKLLSPYERETSIVIRDLVKNIYFPKYMPPYQSLFCDDKGYLYVMTYEKGTGNGQYMCDIFDADGRFISRLGLGNYAKWDKIVPSQLIVITKKGRLYHIRQKKAVIKN